MSTQTEWSMHEITRVTGTTSRTLRHYDHIGLLPPSRLGSNGYRFYDTDTLVRLQRILLLRELGLGLKEIAEVVDGQQPEAEALQAHLDLMQLERNQLDRRIAAVNTTLTKRAEGKTLMATEMFDGFDHTQYEEEVTQRWGREAYQSGDRWLRSLSAEERKGFQAEQAQIQEDYAEAYRAQLDPGAEQVRAITARLHQWLRAPMGSVSQGYFLGLADLYVADDRFAANYGGTEGATYVRDAMRAYAESAQFDAE
ncbi:MAG TPA: MerR family transcriptional regulator [Candidatus Ruania gallistercoris]|uniref:MerR family transcriptional regulator n=1 Tax=Candidatus Ruania gallistercoris TaxID=2838746 RepID=A0A9D2ECC0_9MICO|nr:MerR family transcriptional regulator [Candidatus Ruania gallistercoris]